MKRNRRRISRPITAVYRVLLAIPFALGLFLVAVCVMLFLVRIEQDVTAGGEVKIESYQWVRASQSGVISKLLVEPGEAVEKGQPLLELRNPEASVELRGLERERAQTAVATDGARRRLDLRRELHPRQLDNRRAEIRQLDLEVRRRDAEVSEAGHRRQSLEARLGRLSKLFEADLVSAGELEEARLVVLQEEERERQIRLQVEEARERRRTLEEGLSLLRTEQAQEILELELEISELEQRLDGLGAQMEVLERQEEALVSRAEMSGVVTGDSLADLLGRGVQRGEAVVAIVDSQSIVVEALVPEEAIVHLRPGQLASVEIQGLPKQRFRTFAGRVTRVDPRPKDDPAGDRTFYSVYLSLDQPYIYWQDRRFYLRDGMRAKAEIVYRSNVPLARVLLEMLTGR